MDASCAIITLLLFVQMVMVLVMLNPVYDVRKITSYINTQTKLYHTYVLLAVTLYFCAVIYIGMYDPLQTIIQMVLWDDPSQFEKAIILNKIEKNCVMTAFSLFLVVVVYGVKSLVAYTACLAELSDRQGGLSHSHSKFRKPALAANMLKIKRSISYETILFAKDLGEQLNLILRNASLSNNRFKLTNILDAAATARLN